MPDKLKHVLFSGFIEVYVLKHRWNFDCSRLRLKQFYISDVFVVIPHKQKKFSDLLWSAESCCLCWLGCWQRAMTLCYILIMLAFNDCFQLNFFWLDQILVHRAFHKMIQYRKNFIRVCFKQERDINLIHFLRSSLSQSAGVKVEWPSFHHSSLAGACTQ